jgi:hypothetical protein
MRNERPKEARPSQAIHDKNVVWQRFGALGGENACQTALLGSALLGSAFRLGFARLALGVSACWIRGVFLGWFWRV